MKLVLMATLVGVGLASGALQGAISAEGCPAIKAPVCAAAMARPFAPWQCVSVTCTMDDGTPVIRAECGPGPFLHCTEWAFPNCDWTCSSTP